MKYIWKVNLPNILWTNTMLSSPYSALYEGSSQAVLFLWICWFNPQEINGSHKKCRRMSCCFVAIYFWKWKLNRSFYCWCSWCHNIFLSHIQSFFPELLWCKPILIERLTHISQKNSADHHFCHDSQKPAKNTLDALHCLGDSIPEIGLTNPVNLNNTLSRDISIRFSSNQTLSILIPNPKKRTRKSKLCLWVFVYYLYIIHRSWYWDHPMTRQLFVFNSS